MNLLLDLLTVVAVSAGVFLRAPLGCCASQTR